MAVGTYNLPICDGCKLPWLPVGWTQDSDPRNIREGAKPLRCGKCKSIGWDREFVKQQKAKETPVDIDETSDIKNWRRVKITPIETFGSVGEATTPSVSKTESAGSSPAAPAMLIVPVFPQAKPGDEGYGLTNLVSEHIPPIPRARCKHRMTDCPVCHTKEPA